MKISEDIIKHKKEKMLKDMNITEETMEKLEEILFHENTEKILNALYRADVIRFSKYGGAPLVVCYSKKYIDAASSYLIDSIIKNRIEITDIHPLGWISEEYGLVLVYFNNYENESYLVEIVNDRRP